MYENIYELVLNAKVYKMHIILQLLYINRCIGLYIG